MSVPLHYDVRGGIRNWGGALGNYLDGDCVIAGFEQLRKTKNVTAASTWRRVLYRLGFRPPHEAYTIAVYSEYLATVGEKPGPTVGVDPGAFFTWAKAKGLVKDFGSVEVTNREVVEQAMIDHRGLLLVLNLTRGSYTYAKPGALWNLGPAPQGVPDPQLGHAIALVAYDQAVYNCVTWGLVVRLTPEYFAACVYGAWYFD